MGQDGSLRAECHSAHRRKPGLLFVPSAVLPPVLFLRLHSYPPQTLQYHKTPAAKTAGVAEQSPPISPTNSIT